MRTQRNFINLDGDSNIKSSFLSCEKDTEAILKKLFIDSKPYSDELKRLLLISNKDCLDDRTNEVYLRRINSTSLADLIDEGYIKLQPEIDMNENEDIKSYIVITFGGFTPNPGNEHFRDCTIEIDVLSHLDYWNLGNFRQRPLKIAGYIDGILNNTQLTGIGRLNFMGAKEIGLGDNLSGYCLLYKAVHGEDDLIESEE